MNLQSENAQGKEFVGNLEIRLKDHLFDPKLSVRKILRLVFMSRTDLHRKLKKETGMSATEFVRFSRLAKAKVLLLEHPDWTIFRVALEVGFVSQSYFTKIFKKVFGYSPKEFRSRSGV